MVRVFMLAMVALVLTAPASAETKPIRQSWGKAGVGYEQYRADAIECGHKGHDLDISQTDDAKAFVSASQQYETTLGEGPSGSVTQDPTSAATTQATTLAQIKAGLNVDKRMQNVGTMLQTAVDQCLAGKGYRRFDLTDAQRRDLARLKIGSQERRDYLYHLASDPAVLERQAAASSDHR